MDLESEAILMDMKNEMRRIRRWIDKDVWIELEDGVKVFRIKQGKTGICDKYIVDRE